MLRQWNGADAAARPSPDSVAETIDQTYRDYVAALPAQTAAVLAGQAAWERKVG